MSFGSFGRQNLTWLFSDRARVSQSQRIFFYYLISDCVVVVIIQAVIEVSRLVGCCCCFASQSSISSLRQVVVFKAFATPFFVSTAAAAVSVRVPSEPSESEFECSFSGLA